MVSRKACHTLLAISSLLAAAPLHEAMAQPSGDHFKCYRARVTPFARRTATLLDQFASSTASVVRPARFCAPADKNGEGIDDPTAHLMCYQIREAAFSRRTVLVRNQFGDQTLMVLRPESLCNPAEKNGVPSQLGINHFKCYRVAGPGFAQLTVSVADQFETQSVTLLTPRLLCNPVDKNGEGIVDPAAHLTCYTIKPGGAPFTPTSINVVDQFAQEDLTILRGECRKRSLLCVPSEKNPGGTTSSTTSSTSSSIVTTSSSTTSMTTSTSSTTSTSATTTSSTSSTTSTSATTTSSTSSSTSTSMTTSTTVTTTTSLSTSTTETTSTTTPIDTTTTTTEPIVAICGNNEVEEGEGCDPPGSSCACSLGPDGICSGFCFCLMCES